MNAYCYNSANETVSGTAFEYNPRFVGQHFNENKVNDHFIETKKLFSIILKNRILFKEYLGGENFNVLNKMITHNLNNKICSLEQIDSWVEEKKVLSSSLLDINKLSTKYTIYMKKPWSIFSQIELIYTNAEAEASVMPSSNEYEYFLEMFIIKDELLRNYIKELKTEKKYSINNLATMIIGANIITAINTQKHASGYERTRDE